MGLQANCPLRSPHNSTTTPGTCRNDSLLPMAVYGKIGAATILETAKVTVGKSTQQRASECKSCIEARNISAANPFDLGRDNAGDASGVRRSMRAQHVLCDVDPEDDAPSMASVGGEAADFFEMIGDETMGELADDLETEMDLSCFGNAEINGAENVDEIETVCDDVGVDSPDLLSNALDEQPLPGSQSSDLVDAEAADGFPFEVPLQAAAGGSGDAGGMSHNSGMFRARA